MSEPTPHGTDFYGGDNGLASGAGHLAHVAGVGGPAPPVPHGAPAASRRGSTACSRSRVAVQATKDDIATTDDPALSVTAPLTHDSIHIVTSLDGRPSGMAFVEFASAEDAKAAMSRDGCTMGSLANSSPRRGRRRRGRRRRRVSIYGGRWKSGCDASTSVRDRGTLRRQHGRDSGVGLSRRVQLRADFRERLANASVQTRPL